jgi:hypothetical protein
MPELVEPLVAQSGLEYQHSRHSTPLWLNPLRLSLLPAKARQRLCSRQAQPPRHSLKRHSERLPRHRRQHRALEVPVLVVVVVDGAPCRRLPEVLVE